MARLGRLHRYLCHRPAAFNSGFLAPVVDDASSGTPHRRHDLWYRVPDFHPSFLDSIVGFALPFAAVSATAAWVAASSPRLSYFGRQMALAYYLTMFQGWGITASLATSRDRLMGILLGLPLMWLVFDTGFHRGRAETRRTETTAAWLTRMNSRRS